MGEPTPSNEADAWLLKLDPSLGPFLAQARKAPASGAPLMQNPTVSADSVKPAGDHPESHFPTDAKERKNMDDVYARQGKERVQQAQKPKDKEKGSDKDLEDEIIEKTIGDPVKRAKAMVTWNVPKYTDLYKKDTPEIVKYLTDIQNGLRKVHEYIDYINKAGEYLKKYGDVAVLKNIKNAASGILKVTNSLSWGLGKVDNIIDKAEKIATFLNDLNDFAHASSNMDPKDIQSVLRWTDSLEHLWNSTTPVIDWLKKDAPEAIVTVASESAAALTATLAVVGSEIFIGIKVLKAGVQAEAAYFAKMDKAMQEIFPEDYATPVAQREPPPTPPPDNWMSWEDAAQDAPGWENDALRGAMHAAVRRDQDDYEQKIDEATRKFDATEFPAIYAKARRELVHQLLQAVITADEKGPPELSGANGHVDQAHGALMKDIDWRSHARKCWSFLTPANGAPPYSDLTPASKSISTADAETEIGHLTNDVFPACAVLTKFRAAELKKYLDKNVPPGRSVEDSVTGAGSEKQ